MTPARSRPGLRGRLLLLVLGALAVALVALVAGFNLVLDRRLDRQASGVARARAVAEVDALRVAGGLIVLPEAPDDALASDVWVFAGARALERPRTSHANDRAAAALARGRVPAARDVPGTSTRLYAAPIVRGGRRLGTVVAAVALKPYEQTRRSALVGSVILASLLMAAMGAAAAWLISRSLRPVASMTRQAAQWSERDLDRRFGLGAPHDELTQLAATLDGLLDRLAASLRREQRLSAELSHELRTPLASVIAEAQFALRHAKPGEEHRETLERILAGARRMERTLDVLMAAARAELRTDGAGSDATASVRASAETWREAAARRNVSLEVSSPPAPARVGVERDVVERILAPLIDNACRHARTTVRLTVERADGAVSIVVADDGDGVAPADRTAIFEPGRRGSGTSSSAGAGLGLSLARRLARAAGGDVELDRPGGSGARFRVRLPAG